jgi:pimeloyl-ACP methyl ester carboxylesterase
VATARTSTCITSDCSRAKARGRSSSKRASVTPWTSGRMCNRASPPNAPARFLTIAPATSAAIRRRSRGLGHDRAELRAELKRRNIDPPYVLVGHSLGGLYMQYFARNYPKEVAGLLLVDSTHWHQGIAVDASANTPYMGRTAVTLFMPWIMRREIADSVLAGQQVHASPEVHDFPTIVLSSTRGPLGESGAARALGGKPAGRDRRRLSRVRAHSSRRQWPLHSARSSRGGSRRRPQTCRLHTSRGLATEARAQQLLFGCAHGCKNIDISNSHPGSGSSRWWLSLARRPPPQSQ